MSALLWLLYLLPSWRGRNQFYASERNAVRLNQALRVLAETSETPGEVHLELNARSAHAQQKLAKRVQAEREAAELELLRAELAATRADPAVRQARARRRVRMAATVVLLAGLALTALGVWQILSTGATLFAWTGAALVVAAALVLQRMSSVAARAARREAAGSVAATPRVAPPLHDQGRRNGRPGGSPSRSPRSRARAPTPPRRVPMRSVCVARPLRRRSCVGVPRSWRLRRLSSFRNRPSDRRRLPRHPSSREWVTSTTPRSRRTCGSCWPGAQRADGA
ncbi:large exoprotein [Microbacterium sp. NIBRBAC000506063]|uniref:large exoprotein n=1 Tax=Microbacterium sp. NIBRBAC000506063 TaxID=2734618 RepID=UPI001CB6C311|nr:large exoprotein [Microbacterium sp. NIBRBAC000506063]